MQKNILMFTIATNGFNFVYKDLIKTHKEYAKRNKYKYLIVKRPLLISKEYSAWLKIPLILEGLKKGYEWVFFIDADCRINEKTKPIEWLEKPKKFLYIAKGVSGRVNSGVIITKNNEKAKEFFNLLIENCEKTNLPYEDSQGTWGENPHVIHYSKGLDGLEIINSKWNNNAKKDMDDYIRHYTSNLKDMFNKSKTSLVLLKITNRINNPFLKTKKIYKRRLQKLSRYCSKKYNF